MSTAKDQAASLLNELLSFAEQLLQQHGELFPIAGIVDQTGASRHLVAGDTGAVPATAAAMQQQLEAGLRVQIERGECQLAVLVTAVSVVDPASGHTVDLLHAAAEHQQGYAADIYLPYTITNGTLEYGESFFQERTPELFPGDGAAGPAAIN